ncbi:rho-related GTP-binding protein RhoE [Egretta garzetta]|uniref:rho-related GTP-binding protein RhoE n=1 Tax=Egretta garzetta TaxID=188379 RepID=UPI00163C69CA|nr:rho-related GTP-binding protein RhoE [Egretta garzetta]
MVRGPGYRGVPGIEESWVLRSPGYRGIPGTEESWVLRSPGYRGVPGIEESWQADMLLGKASIRGSPEMEEDVGGGYSVPRISRSPYYDNVRPLSYPDSDAVLICFDISRPETLDSVLKKWKGEIQEFCPNTKMLLVGCKSDLRTDVSTLVELSNHRQTPVSYDQGANMAKQIGAATYIECSALQSENSVRDIFHVATLACVNKTNKNVKRNKSQRATKRISHMPGRPELSTVATDLRKDKAKSCTVM